MGLLITPNGVAPGKIFAYKPTNGSGDGVFDRNTTATRVNSAGLIEDVAIDMARIDYPTNGSCPHLLFEPQSTNLITYSEDFSQVPWYSIGSIESVVTDVNPIDSNVYEIESTLNSASRIYVNSIVSSGNYFSVSLLVKQTLNTPDFIGLAISSNSNCDIFYDIVNNVFSDGTKSSALCTSELLSNGYYYLTFPNVGASGTRFNLFQGSKSGNVLTGVTGESYYLKLVQLEQLPYATSYIPTNGSAVTRVKDVANSFGDVNSFNSEEGVLFVDLKDYYRISGAGIGIYDVSGNQVYTIYYYGGNYDFYNGSVFMLDRSIIYPVGSKIAIVYTLTSIKFYINGIEAPLINSSLSGNTPYKLGTILESSISKAKVKQVQVYKEALTDAELEYLTTYATFPDLANANNYNLILNT